MPRMRTTNKSYAKSLVGKINTHCRLQRSCQAEVPQAKIFAQLLAKVEGLQKTNSTL